MIEKCPKCAQAGVDDDGEPLYVCRECLEKTLNDIVGRLSALWEEDIERATATLRESIGGVARARHGGSPADG